MVSIQNLHFSYKKKKVFDGLNLELKPGHIYGLLGKNGMGKSTLLCNMAGLLFPKEGVVRVNEFNPAERQAEFLQGIYMVPEEFHLPNISIEAFLDGYAPFYPQFNNQQFQQCLHIFDIPRDSTLQHMSYGQKKKVLISFALASNAKLLLMDEPTNGLDIMSKSQFRKVLAESINDERCIIVSTHQVKDLENLIDRVTIIEDGRILFDQTVEAIVQKLSFRYSFDDAEVKAAFYAEPSLRGSVIVAANTEGEEGKLDLELLYKAIVTNGITIQKLFNV